METGPGPQGVVPISTGTKQGGAEPFKPGQSGNPRGRPPGSRNKLGEAFLAALHADFLEHGADVIKRVRNESPAQYLKIVASTLPREIEAGEVLSDVLGEVLARVDGRTRAIDIPAARLVASRD